ncbi:MAG: UDP-N-acetyl-D-glucosamine dehydrogenase, partial [Candidatus Marinimicrobia bacterium]|nr:UDP-N-acetyl-D-glucosamine dehydrogenase [Candidatus Neomarinimicrobiota bacterium]
MNLKNIIDNREAQIGVIGLGYVGLPLAIEFVHAGFTVTGIDIDELRVKTLNEGNNYIQDVSDKHLRDAVENNKFSASTEFSVIKNLDCVIICV